MPAPAVTSLAKKAGKEGEGERLWDKAKEQAAKQDRGDDYAYIMGIFKRMLGLEENVFESFLLFEAKMEELSNGAIVYVSPTSSQLKRLQKRYKELRWVANRDGWYVVSSYDAHHYQIIDELGLEGTLFYGMYDKYGGYISKMGDGTLRTHDELKMVNMKAFRHLDLRDYYGIYK